MRKCQAVQLRFIGDCGRCQMFQEAGVCIYFPLPWKIFLELGYVPCRKKANVLHLNQCTTEKPKEGWMDRWMDEFTSSERHLHHLKGILCPKIQSEERQLNKKRSFQAQACGIWCLGGLKRHDLWGYRKSGWF